MKLARFRRMMMGVRAVAGRTVCVMRRTFVIFVFVMLGGFTMVARGMFVMFRGLVVMFAGGMLVRHIHLLL